MWTGKNYWERTSSTPSFGGEFENVFAGDVPPSIGLFFLSFFPSLSLSLSF